MKYPFFIIALLTGLAVFTSCEKENIDIPETEVVEIDPEVVECDFNVDIIEEPSGLLTALLIGGTSPYTYIWSTGDSTTFISFEDFTTYSVTVTDSEGCTAEKEIETGTTNCTYFSVNPDTINVSTQIEITISNLNGVEPYTYIWSTGETSQTITTLETGLQSVTITDANGCIAFAFFNVIGDCDDFNVKVSPEVVTPSTDFINVDITNGVPPYTYQWSNGQITPIIVPIQVGEHSVTVTDANGCSAIGSFEFVTCEDLIVQLSTVAVGEVTAIVLGGTAPYTYFWHNGLTSPSIPTFGSGGYSVTVTDANGCIVSQFADVKVSDDSCDELEVKLASSSSLNSLEVNVIGGSGNYEYLWSTNWQGNPLAVFDNGIYNITVTDLDSGCSDELGISYTLADNCTDFAIKVIESSPGTIEINACGGEAPYSYTWSNGASSQVLTNLENGLYNISVVDSDGCLVVVSYVVDLQEECNGFDTEIVGDAAGRLTTITCGGTEPFSYLWSTGEASSIITPYATGIYSVTITDVNGCTTTDIIQL